MEVVELQSENINYLEYKLLKSEHEKLFLISDGLIGANIREMALAMAEVKGVIDMIDALMEVITE